MDYLITFFLMLLGAALHVMSKISALRKRFPELEPKTIWGTFYKEEWNTLIVNLICILLAEVFLYTTISNGQKFAPWFDNYGMYGLAVLWGYAGQRLAYKFLSTGEAVLEKKAEQIKDSNG